MMNAIRKVKCDAGHFYDTNRYRECPLCVRNDLPDVTSSNYEDKVARLAVEYIQDIEKQEKLEDKAFEYEANISQSEEYDTEYDQVSQDAEEMYDPYNDLSAQDAPDWDSGQEYDQQYDQEFDDQQDQGSLEESEQGNALHRDGYFVTGWLVCTDGPDRGHCFSLYKGYNTAGTHLDNPICILADPDIAEGVHFTVIYDDISNQFYLFPQEVTYCNNELAENVMELHSHDQIKAGNTVLEFIAFCGGDCIWN